MNHDETHLPPKPEMQTWIEPELEARIVAWIAGEASPFEVAELERLVAEKPELAIFKRRLEAVHGLVAEAARPDQAPLHLAPERRGKLLATLRQRAEPAPLKERIAQLPKLPSPWSWRAPRIYFVLSGVAAACLVFLVTFPMAKKPLYRSTATLQFEKPDNVVQVSRVSDVAIQSEYDLNTYEQILRSERLKQRVTESLMRDAQEAQTRAEAARARGAEVSTTDKTLLKMAGLDGQSSRPKSEATLRPSEARARAARDTAVRQRELSDQLVAAAPMARTIGLSALSPQAPPTAAPPTNTLVGYSGIVAAPTTGRTTAIGASPKYADIGFRAQPGANATVVVKPADASSLIALGQGSGAGALTLGGNIPMPQLSFGAGPGAFEARRGAFSGGIAAADAASFGNRAPAAGDAGAVVTLSPFMVTESREVFAASAMSAAPVRSNKPALAEALKSERPFQEAASPITLDAFAVKTDKDASQTTAATFAGSPVPQAGDEQGAKKQAPAEEKAKQADDEPRARTAPPPPPIDTETTAAKEPASTFSLHVGDVSFRLAQAALARGEIPDASRIRPEEFYNAFDYGDPAPSPAEKVSCRIEQSAHPFLQQRNLVRIALKIGATGRGAGTPLRLTVLLDTSGSMEREDRRATVQRAMAVLVSLLGANDRITLIGFARTPRLLAEAVAGHSAAWLVDILAHTPPDGGTNLEAALQLAGELARRHRDPSAQNRIVLLTDGAANLGNADPASLAAAIAALRAQGLAFDACGVGLDGLDDEILESLTRSGDGRYYALNSPADAEAGFAQKLAGAFRPAAENVKLQVRFNPARVGAYRLIGFEQHRLREEDFRNDRVDAAELAAEEAAVALYQIEALPQGEGDLGEVFVRFRDPATGQMVERSWPVNHDVRAAAFDRATPTMQLAGTAALLAEKLRGGAPGSQIKLAELAPVVNSLRSHYAAAPRVQELAAMFAQMRRLTRE